MEQIVSFSTKFESLEQVNPLITKYRINICQPDVPANTFVFSKEVIESMSNTIRGAGVYAYYFEKEKQIGGHEDDIIKTENGYKQTGTPIAYGFSDPYKEPYWMEIDGEQWFTADVYLWTGRYPEIEEALKNPVGHSMEVALESEKTPEGFRKVKEAIFLGFCLLQGIEPAFDGSTITKFSISKDDSGIEKLKKELEDEIVIKEAKKKFSLNSEQIYEILTNALSEYKYGENNWRKYWVRAYDDELVYVYDNEDDRLYSFKYNIENKVATIDMESKDEVIDNGFISISKKEDMSEVQVLSEKVEENNKKLEEQAKMIEEKDKEIGNLKCEVEKMSELKNQVAELTKFKEDIESQNKKFAVDTVLKEVEEFLPQEELDKCRDSAENFTLENIGVWENEVRARAFTFAKENKDKDGKQNFMKVALPTNTNNPPKRGNGLWD